MTLSPPRPSLSNDAEPIRLGDGTLLRDLIDVKSGDLSARVFSDPELFRLEADRLFTTSWVVLAHESELPRNGDYVLRSLGADQVIVSRDQHGKLHVLLNSCSHRRMAVCRVDQGNAKSFKCPYHGFTYSNSGQLLSVPSPQQAYGNTLDKSKLSLVSARCASYGGMIFGCFDDTAPPLDEALGDFKWYLDLMFRRTPGGTEAIGPPQRIRVKANWKLGVENFVGDGYHFNQAHQSERDIGAVPSIPGFPSYGATVHTEQAHGLGINQVPPEIPFPPYNNLPDEVIALIEATLSAGQTEVLKITANMHGSAYPNTSFLYSAMMTERGVAPAPFLLVRSWVPISVDETEVITWNLVDSESPEWFKDISRKTYLRSFGSSGVFEQDDFEIFPMINKLTATPMGRRQKLNYQMGLHKDPLTDWPGPGIVYGDDFCEANQRAFYRRWVEHLETGK
jgi:phenylpropionate dioxygenase-like ring-hydroxylating dioxygenase large terminal subunit